MPSAAEALGQQSQIQATLDAGAESISQAEKVLFQRYKRYALVADGSVFWCATGEEMTASGSLHYSTDRVQEEDQTIGENSVLLTSEVAISAFNVVDPDSMWIARWPVEEAAPPLLVAFAGRGEFYEQSKIWHYHGFAVYPALKTQIIDSAADLPAGPIVSNSLPIWLAQNAMAPVYPSFLVPDNAAPPYVVAHIDPLRTEALAAMALEGPWPGVTVPNSGAAPLHQLSYSILARDEVQLTFYGFDNQMVWQWLAALYDASRDGTAPFGFANTPIPRDAKRTQVELATLAQKKTVEISANYYQQAADAVARRLLLSASLASITVIGGVVAQGAGETVQAEQVVAATGSVFE